MKKNSPLLRIGLMALLTVSTVPAFSQTSAGGGLSFFVPESLYRFQSGSISKEAGLSTSFGVGDYISFPLGFTYIKATGFTAGLKGGSDLMDGNIWFSADTFLPYLRCQGTLPLGPLYLNILGGIAGAWIVAPQPFYTTIENHYSDGNTRYVFDQISFNSSFGWAWQAGGNLGLTIGQISVELQFLYTDLRADMEISSPQYWEIDAAGPTITEKTDFPFEEDLESRLRGFSIGLGGSFAF